ncbi:MAG TPA: hypothetical protein PLT51_00425, partial [Candidatus Dojkabacteria bacterium]|nr:hypothetical protein [Candidatus Dojkabacteria bacterium]
IVDQEIVDQEIVDQEIVDQEIVEKSQIQKYLEKENQAIKPALRELLILRKNLDAIIEVTTLTEIYKIIEGDQEYIKAAQETFQKEMEELEKRLVINVRKDIAEDILKEGPVTGVAAIMVLPVLTELKRLNGKMQGKTEKHLQRIVRNYHKTLTAQLAVWCLPQIIPQLMEEKNLEEEEKISLLEVEAITGSHPIIKMLHSMILRKSS